MSHGIHWWSIISHWGNSHLGLFSVPGTVIRQTVITGGGFLQLVPAPSEAGFVLGDGNAQAFKVFCLKSISFLILF